MGFNMVKIAFFAALLAPALVYGPAYGGVADTDKPATGQQNKEEARPPLSARAVEFVRQYEVYKSSPNAPAAQLDYLKAFPSNASAFQKLFAMDDFSELYDESDKYIFLLKDIAEKQPDTTSKLYISLIKEGPPNCCDAWSYLRDDVSEFYKVKGKDLALRLESLTAEQQLNVIHFITDMENDEIRAEDCAHFAGELRKLKKEKLARLFEGVCRIRIPHD